MPTSNASASNNERLLPDELRNNLIASLEEIESKTPDLPVKNLNTGKKIRGMGQASYGFVSELALIIQSFPDLHSQIYDQTVSGQLQNLNNVDEVLLHLNKLQQRYQNARQVLGHQIMEMANEAYANLKRRADKYPEYNTAFHKVKVFYERSKKEQRQPKAAVKIAVPNGENDHP